MLKIAWKRRAVQRQVTPLLLPRHKSPHDVLEWPHADNGHKQVIHRRRFTQPNVCLVGFDAHCFLVPVLAGGGGHNVV